MEELDPDKNTNGLKNTLDKQVLLLNMLEEFAIRIKHFNTSEHPAIKPVIPTFVLLVEQNAVALLFMRDIISNDPIYSNILDFIHYGKIELINRIILII